MPPQSTIQTNFTSGEVSPLMRGRVDVNKYANGAETLLNCIVRPQGGATRRMGTEYVTNAHATTQVRLREFIVSNANPYVLEFGVGYIRIFKQGSVLSGAPILTTSYQATDLNNLSFTQIGDEMYIACQGYQPQILTKYSDTNWTFTPYIPIDGPYLATDQSGAQLTVSNYTDVGVLSGAPSSTFELVSPTAFTGSGFTVTGKCPLLSSAITIASGKGATIYATGQGTLTLSGGTVSGTIYFSSGESITISGGSVTGMTNPFTLNCTIYIDQIVGNPSNPGYIYFPLNATISGGNYIGNFTALFGLDGSGNIYWQSVSGTTGAASGNYAAASTTPLFVDYWDGGAWQLFNVTGPATTPVGAVDGTMGVGQFIPNIKTGIDPNAKLTFSGSTLTSSLSEVFTWTDVGMYVRASSGTWYLITAFLTDSTVTATACSMISYSPAFPTTILQEANRSASISVSSTATTFASTDLGRMLRLNFASTQVWCTIVGFISTSSVVATLDMNSTPSPLAESNGVLPAIKQTSTNVTTTSFAPAPYVNKQGVIFAEGTRLIPVITTTHKRTHIPLDPVNYGSLYNNGVPDNWRLGAWSNTTGWPAVVGKHQDRLMFMNTPIQPNTWWASYVDDYTNMAPTEADSTVTDANAITFTIVNGGVDSINWMTSGQVMLMGTDGGEYRIQPDSTSTAITPSDCDCIQQTPFGSRQFLEATRIGIANLFVERSGIRVREMIYNFQFDAFEAHDLTTVSEHILRRGGYAIRNCFQLVPYSIYWILLNDGTLASLTYEHDQQVIAWAQHQIGNNGTSAVVESICCIPSTDGTWDQLWMSVKRTVNGSVVRTIETMAQDFSPIPVTSDTSGASAIHLDCCTTYSGSAINSLPVSSNLNGETLQIYGNGIWVGSAMVSGGALPLPDQYTTVTAGYNFQSKIRILPLEGSGPMGTTSGDLKRVHWLVLRLLNTLAYTYGKDSTHQINPNLRDLGNVKTGQFIQDVNGAQIPQFLLTADVRHSMDNNTTFEGQYEINSNGPYPFTILALINKLVSNI